MNYQELQEAKQTFRIHFLEKDYKNVYKAREDFVRRFPPNDSDSLYHGYKTPAEECLFYDFAVQGFDLMIRYKGVPYYFMVDTDCVWLSDANFTAMKKQFEKGNDVLEHFCIDDIPLYKLVDKLDEYEPM